MPFQPFDFELLCCNCKFLFYLFFFYKKRLLCCKLTINQCSFEVAMPNFQSSTSLSLFPVSFLSKL